MALGSTQFAIVLLGVWFSSLSFICECRSLDGYEFPVSTTKACPKNLTEWKERSNTLSCNTSNAYMCMPNQNITYLLEFCYSRGQIRILKGLCAVLQHHSTVHVYRCVNFTSGCPSSDYRSKDVEKYYKCVSIGNGCFLAEPSCVKKNVDKNSPTNNEDKKNNHVGQTVGIVLGLIIVIIIIIIIIIYCKIKKSEKKQNQQNKCCTFFEICKRHNKEGDDKKVTENLPLIDQGINYYIHYVLMY